MKVTLLHSTPLWVCARAIRTCWNSHDKSDTKTHTGTTLQALVDKNLAWYKDPKCGEKDRELIARVGNKNKHKSVLEHLQGIAEIVDVDETVYLALLQNNFINVTGDKQKLIIGYNLRALQDLKVNINFKMLLCPKEWEYLLKD